MNRIVRRAWVLAWVLVLSATAGPSGSAGAATQPPVSTAQLQAMLSQEGKSVFLLDVRTSGEWARGRIPGSVHIPMDEVPRRLQEIPRDKKIVAVCASGARSEAVARYLGQQGFSWVANYRDGVSGWSRAGLELER